MPTWRRHRTALAIAAISLLATPVAHAAGRPSLGAEAEGTHVLVHYDPAATSATLAHAVAAAADRAWSLVVLDWGFQPPPSDRSLGGDDRLDLYLTSSSPGARSDDANTGPSSGYVVLDPTSTSGAVVARSIFRLVARGYDVADAGFATAATAELLAANAFPTAKIVRPAFLAAAGRSLDCDSVVCGTGGEGQWPFFEFIREHYGSATLRALWTHLAPPFGGTSSPVRALSDALRAAGSSLGDAWNRYARTNLSPSAYSNRLLRGLPLPSAATTLSLAPQRGVTGWATATLPHLATSYLLVRSSSCTTVRVRPSRLVVSVTVPPGTGAVPAVRMDSGRVVPLHVRGGTASGTVAFAPCSRIFVALPNPSLRDNVAFRASFAVR